MSTPRSSTWQELAAGQADVLSFRQLRTIGVTRTSFRHHVKVGRWAQRSSQVLTTTTGPDLAGLSALTALPLCRLEPAVLLFSGYAFNRRTAHGALAAVVRQRLTTPDKLRAALSMLSPLRRASEFRLLLDDLDGGAQSLAEVDVKKACRDFGVTAPSRRRVGGIVVVARGSLTVNGVYRTGASLCLRWTAASTTTWPRRRNTVLATAS